MKKIILSLILFSAISTQNFALDGEKNFKTVCATCHTIGKGRLVGPDLKNVHSKYEESWLLKWVKSSQTLVKQNDEKAVAVFKQFGEIPMPDNLQFSDEDVKSIIAYIKTQSEKPQETPAVASRQMNTTTTVAESSNIGKSGNTYLYVGIGLVILFFLSVLIVLMRSVIVLSDELKKHQNKM